MYKSRNSKGMVNILGAFKVILVIALLGGGFLLFAHYVMDWDVLGFVQGFGGGGGASGGAKAASGGTSTDSDSGLGGMMPIILVVGIIALIIWRGHAKKKERAERGEEEGDMRTLEGYVVDNHDARITDRSITIRFKPQRTFRKQQKAQTREDGSFSVQLVDNITYEVEIEKNSYKHFRAIKIRGRTFTDINDPAILGTKRWGGLDKIKIRNSRKDFKIIILEARQEYEGPPPPEEPEEPPREGGDDPEDGNGEDENGDENGDEERDEDIRDVDDPNYDPGEDLGD